VFVIGWGNEAIVPGTYEEKCNYIKELEQIVLLCVSGSNVCGTNACIRIIGR